MKSVRFILTALVLLTAALAFAGVQGDSSDCPPTTDGIRAWSG